MRSCKILHNLNELREFYCHINKNITFFFNKIRNEGGKFQKMPWFVDKKILNFDHLSSGFKKLNLQNRKILSDLQSKLIFIYLSLTSKKFFINEKFMYITFLSEH